MPSIVPHDFSYYARQSPNHLALVAPDGRHWSRGELQAECDRLAQGLGQLGLAPGDRVTIALPNCAEFFALVISIMRVGGEISAWDANNPPDSLAGFLQGPSPRLLIGHERLADTATRLKSALELADRQSVSVGTIAGFGRYEDLLPASLASQKEDIIDNPAPGPALLGIKPGQDNVHYCSLPLADPDARSWAIDSLNYGHAVILTDTWDARKMLRDIDRYRVTTAYMVPAQFTELLELPPEVRGAWDVSSIDHVICPAGQCPQPLKTAMTQWWEISLYENSAGNYLDPQAVRLRHVTEQANNTLN